MSVYNFSSGTVTLLKDNVILIKYDEIKPITLENLKEITQIREKIIGIKHFHSITDFTTGLINITDDAKAYIAQQNKFNNLRLSDSLIVTSMAKKIEISLYLTFNKPTVKTKIFSSLNKALTWIESLNS